MLAVEVAPAVGVGAAIGLALFHVPAKDVLASAFGVFVVGLATLQLAAARGAPLAPRGEIGDARRSAASRTACSAPAAR